jgi:hypothetical protein
VAKVEEAIKTAEAEIWRKTDPAAKARAADVVKQLSDSIAGNHSRFKRNRRNKKTVGSVGCL